MKKRGNKKGAILKSLTADVLIKKLHEASNLLGRPPTYKEMDKLTGFPSATAYENRFGKWSHAFEIANLPKNKSGFQKGENHPLYKKVHKKPQASLRMRFEIFKRDNFTCQYCGRTPQDGVKLVIDHKNPTANNGETRLGNLVTACFECNSGKQDILLSVHQAKKKG